MEVSLLSAVLLLCVIPFLATGVELVDPPSRSRQSFLRHSGVAEVIYCMGQLNLCTSGGSAVGEAAGALRSSLLEVCTGVVALLYMLRIAVAIGGHTPP